MNAARWSCGKVFTSFRASSKGPQHGVEPTLPCHAHILTEACRLFAVVDHQFCQFLWPADGFLIVGNGLLGFGNRYVLVTQDIGPKPALKRFLVRLQHVVTQVESCVEKDLVFLARGVQGLDQSEQPSSVEVVNLRLDVTPAWLGSRFLRNPLLSRHKG